MAYRAAVCTSAYRYAAVCTSVLLVGAPATCQRVYRLHCSRLGLQVSIKRSVHSGSKLVICTAHRVWRCVQHALAARGANSLGDWRHRSTNGLGSRHRERARRSDAWTTLETLHRRGVRARLHVLLPLQADLVLLRDEVRHHEERLLLARLRQQPQRVLRALGVLLRQRDRVI